MTALDLYKFVSKNDIVYNYSHDKEEVYLFVNYDLLSEFNQLLGYHITADDRLRCVMKSGYIGFKMRTICEYFEIELNDVFENK